VLYHSGLPFITGGFTGVDIFFVISGYLIGGNIYSELCSGNFSYLRFYQHRVRRILPAFFSVLVFILLAAMLLLSPQEAIETGRSAFAAVLSASNILFWKRTNYFWNGSKSNPLLMTWSLGVEEQFYAVIPLLMVLLTRIRRKLLFPTIIVICVLSFALAWYELGRNPMFAFYMLPARAWELGLGVALAAKLHGDRNSMPTRLVETMSWAGLTLMLAPVALLSAKTAFPGPAALPSVLGTALVLAVPGSWINRRLLPLPPLLFIGKVSYSWYLWHWPILAFLHVLYGIKLPIPISLLGIALSLVLAALSYLLIEQPLRRSSRAAAPLLLRYATVSAVALVVSAVVWLSDGVPQRFPELAKIESTSQSLMADHCLVSGDDPNLSPACYGTSSSHPAVALWGDSHSGALAPGLRSVVTAQGYEFDELSKYACLPLMEATYYMPDEPYVFASCLHFNHKVFDQLKVDKHVQIVILTARWAGPFYLKAQGVAQSGWLMKDIGDKNQEPTLDASEKLFVRTLMDTIRSLQATGKEVVVLQDVPEFEDPPIERILIAKIPTRRVLARWLEVPEARDSGYSPSNDVAASGVARASIQTAVGSVPNAVLFDLRDAFCTTSGGSECAYRNGEMPLFIDRHHLSIEGARYALRDFSLPALTMKSD
jgi:peptidoglycan/LPS O-acetylase OafA/YrhL